MWNFAAAQKKLKIGNVLIGGLPGEQPTVLIGTIFYHGQKILINETTGEFNRNKAEILINRQEEFSEKTGNPHMIDVVGASPEAMRKFIDFVASTTDAPILMDGASTSVMISGLEYVRESGLTDRIVYNSLTPEFKPEELEKIKETDMKNAILLAYNTRDSTSQGRIVAIEMLLPKAYEAGIENPLIDTCVLDIPSLGMSCRAIFNLKNKFGLPVGCGPHNAISTWKYLKKKMGKQAVHPSIASVGVITVAIGADFVLYGPIEHAEYMFPVIGMVDAAYSTLFIEQGKRLSPNHPIFKINKLA